MWPNKANQVAQVCQSLCHGQRQVSFCATKTQLASIKTNALTDIQIVVYTAIPAIIKGQKTSPAGVAGF